MSQYTQQIELCYRTITDHDLPVLTDPSGHYSREDLKDMSHQVKEFIELMARTGERTFVCDNPPKGLPATWKVTQDQAPPSQRGIFKKLVPVYKESERQLNRNGSHHDRTPASQDGCPQTIRSDILAESIDNTLPSYIPATFNCSSENRPEALHDIETSDWQSGFLKEVARVLTDSECISRSSDRAVQTEILEQVLQESEKKPNQFAMILYQSLIRALYQAARKEHRRHDAVRFELGLAGLEQILSHRFHDQRDKVHPIPPESVGEQSEGHESSWFHRALSLWFYTSTK